MRTLDRKYLATHPEGDEKAVLTFTGEVPSSIAVPANPDGTRPSVTFNVTGENYMDLIQALDALHKDEAEQFLWELIEQVVTEEEAASVGSAEEAAALMKARTREVVAPFRTLTVEMSIKSTTSFGITSSSDVVFELTTPSINAGIALAMDVSQTAKLGNLMVSLSPETDDEDDEEGRNEVLVVS